MSGASSLETDHLEARNSEPVKEGGDPVVRQKWDWNAGSLVPRWPTGLPAAQAAAAILAVILVVAYMLQEVPKATLLDSISRPESQNASSDAVRRMQTQVDQLSQKLRQANNKVWSTLRRLKKAETAAARTEQLDQALEKERERNRKLTKEEEELRESLRKLVQQVKKQASSAPCNTAGNGSLCAALVDAKRKLVTECYAPLGSAPFKGSPEECSLAAEILRTSLVRAEQQYDENLKHRRRMYRGQLFKLIRRMPPKVFRGVLLLPLYPCPLEGRFGAFGDGGKWICMVHYNTSARPLIISVGSKGDTTFEHDAFQRLHAFSHTFDFSLNTKQINKMWSKRGYLKFHNAGLAGKSEVASLKKRFKSFNPVILTLPEIMSRIKARYVDILKVDCEGCEVAMVQDLKRVYNRTTVPFGQVLVEIHHISTKHRQLIGLVIAMEELGFRMFHSEENGFWLEGFELAFIHERLVKPLPQES